MNKLYIGYFIILLLYYVILYTYIISAVCEDLNARILVGSGESYYGGGASQLIDDLDYISNELSVGRVEVCFQGAWRSLCSSRWTRQDASVVCKQLGFAAAG